MTRRIGKTMIVLALTAVALVLVCSFVHTDGVLRPAASAIVVPLHGSETWYAEPALASKAGDPGAVYIVPNVAAPDALRVDTAHGTQTPAEMRPQREELFVPAQVSAGVRGLRFRRPALHLAALPDGRGPGLHLADSVTGVVDVRAGTQLLLSRTVFNSSSTEELLARTWTDPGGRWIALLSRSADGWTLYLFARTERAAGLHPQFIRLEDL
jgi:hypothetical protein